MKLFLRAVLLFFLFFGFLSNSKAQSSGDYRTIAAGAFNGTSVWQSFNGLFWINTTFAPSNTSGTITILHSVTIGSGLVVNADQLVISSGGTLTITNGTLNLYNGTGNDLTLSGGTLTLNNASSAINAASGSATMVANSGSVNLSGGTIGAGISFYNYNPTTLSIIQSSGTTFTLNGALYNFSANSTWNAISANFIIGSNGYFSVESGATLSIIGSGNVYIGSISSASLTGSFAVFGTVTKSTASTLTINTGYFYNYGTFQLTTIASTVNINSGGWSVGNFAATINGSIFNYETSTKILYAGTTLSGSGVHNINAPIAYFINGTSAFNFSSTINFNVPTDIPADINITSSILNCNRGVVFEGPGYSIFRGNSQITNGVSGSFSTTVNDTLSIQPTFGTTAGPSALTINSNISINGPMVTSPASVCQLNGAGIAYFSGNYLSNGGRIVNTNFKFIGNTTQQVSGVNGIISTAEIDNVNTVQFASNHTISTALNFTNGKVTIFYKLFMPGTAAITGSGNGKYFYGAGYLKRTLSPSSTYIYPVGSSTDYLPATLVTASTFVADTIWVKVEQYNFNSVYDSQLNALGNAVSSHVVDPVWHVTESTASGSAFSSLKLQWNASNEKYLFNRASCGIVRNSLGSWNAPVAGASTGSNPYTRTLTTPTLASTKSELFGVADNSVAYTNNYISSNVQTRSACAGTSFSFNFYVGDSSSISASNVFTAQLSNANGSFASPTTIGSVTARGGRLLPVTIPLGTAPGNYYIRVVSSSPVMAELINYANYYNQRVSVQTVCYCGGNLSSACTGSYISEVNINTLDRVSNCENVSGTSYSTLGIEDYNSDGTYTPNTTYIKRGTSELLYVTTNVSSIISVWIDYNKNGTYEASEWTQVTTSSVANQSASVSIPIPANASLGYTGMRVRSRLTLNSNGATDACTLFGSGETEEYYVYITDNIALQSISPTANNRCAPASVSPSITYNTPIKTSSINSKNVIVQGNISGLKAGVFSGGNTATINFNPTQNFEPGELITMATSGTKIIDTAGQVANEYCYQFTTGTAVAPKTFKKHAVTGSGLSVVNSYSADFNNDGFVDILDVNSNSSNGYLSIYKGNGNGTFLAPSFINTGAVPYSAAIADYDMDGDMDIAVGYGAVYRVDVYYNSGNGTFTAPYTINTNHRPRIIIPFFLLDNEAPSIATANYADSTISIIQNYGNGVLAEKTIRKVTGPVQSIVAGDFNLNGLLDIAACLNNNKIVILEFASRKSLTIRSIFSSHGSLPIDIKTADFNGDGDLDLVWSNFSSGTIGYARGSAGITFDTVNVTTLAGSSFPYKIALADFDGDCDIDISCTSANTADFNLFENTAGTFSNFTGPKGNSAAGYVLATTTADFDEDGDIDIVASSAAFNSKSFLENASYSIQTGTINGPLCNNATFTVSWTVSDTLTSTNIFYIQLSNASGSFSSPITLDTISGNFSGSASVTLPTVAVGTGYRIRVISSLPAVIAYDNGTNLGIGTSPATANINFSCSGNNTVLTASGATTYTWSPSNHLSSASGATVTATMPFTGIIQLTAKDAGGCPTVIKASVGTSCYCYPDYAQRDCSQDFLANLSFNTLNYVQNGCSGNDNNTTVHNYDSTNFTPGTTVNKLSTYTLSLMASSFFQEGIGVWIDYNRDLDFADAGEFVYASPTITNQTYIASIAIPASAVTGITRMRVMTIYNTLVTASDYCNQTLAYGSTEDFTIYIDACIPPTSFTVGGGGTICSTQTSSVTLGSSVSGVSYTLYRNATSTGTTLAGNGTVLTFSSLNQAGTYTVVATNALGCTATMTGSAVITVNSVPTTAAAGSDQTRCGFTTATLAANAPTSGTGAWSIVSGTGGSFSTTTNPAATFTGAAGSTYTLRWTINNAPCTASTDDVLISFPLNPTTANAGADQLNLCGLTSTALTANAPTIGVGAWTIVSGTGGSFSNAASPTSTFIGTAGTTYTLRWSITNATCTASTDDVVITFPKNPTTSNAGLSQTLCGASSTTLAANVPTVGSGIWTIFSGTGGSLGTATSATSTFSGVAGNTYVLFWTISNAPCVSSADSMVVSFPKNPSTADAGTSQTLCGLTSTTLAGNTPTVGTGAWSIVSGTGGSFSNSALANSTFTGVAGNSYTLRWTISNSPCTASSATVLISFPKNPTVAAAGADQLNLCGLTSTTLAANTPSVGTGAWTVVTGTGGSFSNATSPSSTFIGTAGTTYTLRWTISNSPCTASTDDVVIAFPKNPTSSNAGVSQTLCGATSTTLSGNTATAGTGLWTIFSGTGGSLGTATSPTSTFSGTAGNTYVLFWTISNSPCAASSDSMVVSFPKNPTTAAAGSDQTLCGATIATLAANPATVGTGAWSKVTGSGGTFGNAASATSTFTGTAGNSYTLRWTISNSPCTSSTDDVIINFPLNPTVANAGNDTNICNGSTINLKANTALVGTGAWSIAGGSCSISNSASPTSTATTFTNNTITSLVWSISNGVCATSRDTVKINSNASFCAATLADFNANATTTCTGNTVIFTDLSSNATSWSWNFGANASPASSTSQGPHSVTYSTTGSKTVSLIATGPGGSNTATKTNYINVLNTPATPTGGITGSAALCAGSTSVTYSILPLTFASSYVWTVPTGATIVGGAGTNSITVDYSASAISGNISVYGTNICGNGGSVSLGITVSATPTTAAAGLDQLNLCGTLSATLNANTASIGTGAWSIVSGGIGSFSNAASASSTFTGTAGSTYTLRWTISNGTCTASTDDVIIKLNQNPTVAAAGADQLNLCGTTSATLAGNTPTIGTGQWTIVSGTGGSFTNASLATSVFVGTAGNSYTLRWTISNAPCVASSDDVTIAFPFNPTTAAAGADQLLCGSTSTTLAANTPVNGSGLWTILSGSGGSFSNAALAGATFTGTAGTAYTLRWTITNSPCAASSDDVLIAFPQNPSTANAGSDQLNLCGTTSATLSALAPSAGTGAWSIVSGGSGSFSNSASATSNFTGTAGATYTLRWTISNAPCTSSSDDVVISFNQNPTVANAGADQINLCGLNSTTLAGNTASSGTGLWTIVSGTGGSFSNAALANSVFVGTAGNTYTLRWTISNAPCTASTDDVVITFPLNPSTATAGSDQILCGLTSATLTANAPLIGTGNWSIVSGTGGAFSNASSAVSTFTGNAGVNYTLRWTISNTPCVASSDDVIISFPQNPSAANAGADQLNLCGTTLATLNATTPGVGTGAWSIISGGTGSFSNAISASSTFTGTAGATYTLRWTVSNSPCTFTSDDVVISFNQNPTVAAAGADQLNLCGITNTSLNANAPLIGTGLWTIISGSGGSIANASLPTSVFVGTAGATYVLRWTISNAPCAASSDDVTITFPLNPTVAAAGADQTLCGATSTSMNGNTALAGNGLWSIVSGSGGSFANAASPTTVFTGIAGNSYNLRWTITNAPCGTSSDDVLISFPQNASVANAGADQLSLCGASSTTLAATSPTVGAGVWTIISGGTGTFSNANNASSTFTGTAGNTYTLRWTVSNSSCTPSSDDVVIAFPKNPTVANAGADQNLCGSTSLNLNANVAIVGSGNWTIVSGTGGSFSSASNPFSNFSGVAGNTYTLRWSISNSPCAASTDDVIISFLQLPSTAFAGNDTIICNGSSISLSANVPQIGNGQWSIISGATTFGSVNSASSTASSFPADSSTVLMWTITAGNTCPDSHDTLVVTSNTSVCIVTLADFTADTTKTCISSTVVYTDQSNQATSWLWDFGAGASPATSTSVGPHAVTYSSSGLKTITLTVSGPGGTDIKTKTNYVEILQVPGAASVITGASSLCEGQTNMPYSVASIANADAYNWVIPNGAAINSFNQNVISVDFGLGASSGNISVEGTNICGTGSSASIAITVNYFPAAAGAINGQDTICASSTNVIFDLPAIANASSYEWILSAGISAISTSTIIPQIAVDLSAGINFGSIQVFGKNACGNGDTSAIFNFYVAPYPDAAGTINGSTAVSTCSNQLGITYTVSPINNASAYNWTLPPLATIVNGATTNSITVNYDVNSSSGNVVVNGINNCGVGNSSSLAVNFMPIPTTEICYATVDSATIQSILYWQRPLETYVDSFIIYSDPTGGTNMTRIAAIKDTVTIPTSFLDPTSNPLINAVSYQIATIDSCHNQLSLSASIVHKTINLNGLIGWSGAAKLYWNDYLGISDPGRYYSVLRDTLGNGPFDDTLATNILPGTSLFYTDASSYLHPNCRYVIVMQFTTSCDPTQKIMLSKSTSRSNIKNRTAMGPDYVNDITADNWVRVFPNPAKGNVNVEIAGVDKDYSIVLTDLLGQNLWSKEIKPINSVRTKTEIPLLNIAPGIYFVSVESAEFGKRVTKLKVE